jgi:hypothetical protein
MSSRDEFVVCDYCQNQFRQGKDEDGVFQSDLETCKCEERLCSRCFKMHECLFHERELAVCVECFDDIDLTELEHSEQRVHQYRHEECPK